jgi:hypothetical protein
MACPRFRLFHGSRAGVYQKICKLDFSLQPRIFCPVGGKIQSDPYFVEVDCIACRQVEPFALSISQRREQTAIPKL